MNLRSTPDDPRWDRLIHLVAGELPVDEAAALREWIALHPARQQALTRLQELWQVTTPTGDARPEAWDAEAELHRIWEENGAGRVIARVEPHWQWDKIYGRRHSRTSIFIRVAAAAVLVVGVGLLWRPLVVSRGSVPPVAAAPKEYRTMPGQQLSLGLSDGTRIVLAPGSILRQSANYGARDRTVYLNGEAYFSVRHDEKRPFTVHTARTVARDLGTRFVVRAYAEDETTDIAVAEGLVAVMRATEPGPATERHALKDSVLAYPRDLVRVTADGSLRLTRSVVLAPYFDWTAGRLVFDATPLHSVVRQLRRWYGIDVRIADPSIRDYRLTATLQQENPADAIDLVATSLQVVRVSRVGDAYVFTRVNR